MISLLIVGSLIFTSLTAIYLIVVAVNMFVMKEDQR